MGELVIDVSARI